jgi:hypothetical protein
LHDVAIGTVTIEHVQKCDHSLAADIIRACVIEVLPQHIQIAYVLVHEVGLKLPVSMHDGIVSVLENDITPLCLVLIEELVCQIVHVSW